MAEAKTTSPAPEAVTVNLTPMLMPGAMLVSSIIMSLSLILSANIVAGGKGLALGTNTNNNAAAAAGTGTGTVTAGKTSIDDDPLLGNKAEAKVAIVEFSDFECPFCQRFHNDTFTSIKKDYIDTGKAVFVYRDYPLTFHEPGATDAAMAGECVQELGGDKKFFEFADEAFKYTGSNNRTQLKQIAGQLGLDQNRFNDCLDNNRHAEEIKKDTADGSAAGVSGTPGFIVGTLNADGSVDGEVIAGAQPYAVFQAAIDRQLNK